MLDESTQERLMALTPESLNDAVTQLGVCWKRVTETGVDEDLSSYPWHPTLALIFAEFPTTLSADHRLRSARAPGVDTFLKERNPPVYRYLQERFAPINTHKALRLMAAIDKLYDIADEAKHDENWESRKMPDTVRECLGGLINENRYLPSPLTPKTKFNDIIYLILKDVRRLHPEVYEEYLRLRSEKRGETPFMRAVKQTLAYKYFSGATGSFTPLCLNDILTSPSFEAMSPHPKHQLILLDMIDKGNFLCGTRGDDSIETKGFRYTWSECRVEVSEDTFYRALDEIVKRGWFKIAGRQKMEDGRLVKLYVPSTDWRTRALSPKDIARIQNVRTDKAERIAKSGSRYRNRQSPNAGIGSSQHTESDTYNTQPDSVLGNKTLLHETGSPYVLPSPG